jgi:hypothetical protein
MKIEAFVICKNEELIMPHLLNYYSQFCQKITFYDNESTDNTLNIINNFDKCQTKIITYSTNGEIRDDIYVEIKNSCWKQSDCDFVIIIDSDEFLYHDNLVEFLSNNIFDVYYPTGYNMISNYFPEDYSKLLTDQVTLGEYCKNYSKSVIFNPKTIKEINYGIGAHESNPIGYSNISIYNGDDLKLLHYKNLGFDYRYNKNSAYGKTLSNYNLTRGFGWHYNMSENEQYSEYSNLYQNKKQVITSIPDVSFVITTCNRLDLLEQTLTSFFNICKFPFVEYIMSDDSGDESVYLQLVEKYGDKFKIIKNNPKLGLSKTIDKLWNDVSSEYIFHCEDDWKFDSNPNLIEDSISILQEHSHVHQVQVRHTYDNPHKPEEQIYSTLNFVKFRKLPWWRDAWTGYSWNPGLRRKLDYQQMFPNGVQEFGDEIDCSKHSMNFNYLAVLLENTSCAHIGYDRHTENFII